MKLRKKHQNKTDTPQDNRINTSLELKSREWEATVAQTEQELTVLYDRIATCDDPKELKSEVTQKLSSFRKANARVRKSYYRSVALTDELSARWNDIAKKNKKSLIPPAPPNAVIDLEETKSGHFARGANLYKLLLVCFIGSFVGVVLELFWCFLTNGYIESRSGLIYGPFNLLYGVAAVALTASLHRYRNRSGWLSFLGGFIVGSIVEYVCSWGQEMLFGSRSWDYTDFPFNINGRICLLFSLIWGALGVFWIKTLYPWLAKLLLKIPNRAGKVITWALLIFFVFNAVVTLITVYRWAQRLNGIEAANAFWVFIDTYFPNERMAGVFANMTF